MSDYLLQIKRFLLGIFSLHCHIYFVVIYCLDNKLYERNLIFCNFKIKHIIWKN